MKSMTVIFVLFCLSLIILAVLFVAGIRLASEENGQETRYVIQQLGNTNNFICKYEFLLEQNDKARVFYRVLYADEIIFIFVRREYELTELDRGKYQLAQKIDDQGADIVQYIVPFKVLQPRYTLCINGNYTSVSTNAIYDLNSGESIKSE